MNSLYKGHKLVRGAGRSEGPVHAHVWNAKRVTFDGRNYWLSSIDSSKGSMVAGPDDVDGTQESAIEFVVEQSRKLLLGPLTIFLREE